MRQLSVAALLLGAACVANADTIRFFDDPVLIAFLLDGADVDGVNFPKSTGTSITGNAPSVGDITFTGNEVLRSASGNALLESDGDAGFNFVEFTGPAGGLSLITFSVYPESSTPFNGTLTVTYAPADAGNPAVETFSVGNGRNELLLYSTVAGTYITKVQLSTDGDLASLKQVSVGNQGAPPNDVLIPEPGTYFLLGSALGALALRRKLTSR